RGETPLRYSTSAVVRDARGSRSRTEGSARGLERDGTQPVAGKEPHRTSGRRLRLRRMALSRPPALATTKERESAAPQAAGEDGAAATGIDGSDLRGDEADPARLVKFLPQRNQR